MRASKEKVVSVKGKKTAQLKRKKRVRKKIRGKSGMPRLTVFKTTKHMYAQIIDDTTNSTLAAASTLSKELRTKAAGITGNTKGAVLVGEAIAQRGLEKGVKKVVFDRNGFVYHGRVKALADAAREHGLQF
jgi:large subunit ribosomal protein L18